MVCTPAQSKQVGDLARRLGGYDELIRLTDELQTITAKGHRPKMITGEDGKRHVVSDGPLPTAPRPALNRHRKRTWLTSR